MPGPTDPPICASQVAGMIGTYASGFSLVEMGSLKLFDLGCLWTPIFSTSVSWVARITGMSHHAPAASLL
jgi:hypothetical protein